LFHFEEPINERILCQQNAFFFFSIQSIIKRIQTISDYPVHLIEDHYLRYYRPDISVRIADVLPPPKSLQVPDKSIKAGLLLHVSSISALETFFANHALWPTDIDLLISAPDTSSRDKIIAEFHRISPNHEYRIRSHDNQLGHPFLSYESAFPNYDIVGYIPIDEARQTSNPPHDHTLADKLLVSAARWFSLFAHNQKIGIIFADQPALVLHDPSAPEAADDLVFIKRILELKSQKYHVSTAGLQFATAPYAGAFWFRPDAMKPLLHWMQAHPGLTRKQQEKILKRLPVYSAWLQDYSFHAIPNDNASIQSTLHQQAVIDQATILTRQNLPITAKNHLYRFAKKYFGGMSSRA
jgi:lipopolysaccharide biosynthesis protein